MGKKVMNEREFTSQFLKRLDNTSLQNIRDKICQCTDLLIDKKVHPMADGLMEILCDPAVMNILSVDQLIKMIDTIFPESIQDEEWICRYGDLLLRVLDDTKKRAPDSRAAKYEKHLREILIPALRKGAHSNDIWDDVEPLEDVYKTTACLYRYYTVKDTGYEFRVDRECLDKLNQAIPTIKGVGNPVLGIEFVPVRSEDRQYAIFLSWILEELLLKDEDMKVGAV